MAAPQFLTPEQCLDRIIFRTRKRIQALRDIRLEGFAAAIAELETVLDLMVRARRYIENVSSKLPPR